MLKVDFTHKDARLPEFETIYPRGEHMKEGGQAFYGLPNSSQFELVEGKKMYEVVRPGVVFRLTLLSSTK
jgi:hypothetical protein